MTNNFQQINVCICNKQETYINEFKRCSACKITFYCSKECQRKDWDRHKQECHKICGNEQIECYNYLKENCTNENVNRLKRIIQKAIKFYGECGCNTEQQIVICDLDRGNNKATFDIITEEEKDAAPDENYRRHIRDCKDKLLIFIQDGKTNTLLAYNTDKVKLPLTKVVNGNLVPNNKSNTDVSLEIKL